MIKLNWIVILSTAIIPTIIGMLWYSKALFGNIWMKESGIIMEDTKKVNMGKAVALSLLLGVFMATALMPLTIHQMGIMGIFGSPSDSAAIKDAASPLGTYVADFMSKYGSNFRTFKHGAFHGTMSAIFLGFALIGMSAIWERKSFKYVLIHVGYWVVCMALMGGIICQWA